MEVCQGYPEADLFFTGLQDLGTHQTFLSQPFDGRECEKGRKMHEKIDIPGGEYVPVLKGRSPNDILPPVEGIGFSGAPEVSDNPVSCISNSRWKFSQNCLAVFGLTGIQPGHNLDITEPQIQSEINCWESVHVFLNLLSFSWVASLGVTKNTSTRNNRKFADFFSGSGQNGG